MRDPEEKHRPIEFADVSVVFNIFSSIKKNKKKCVIRVVSGWDPIYSYAMCFILVVDIYVHWDIVT